MALCKICNREMLQAESCVGRILIAGKQQLAVLSWGYDRPERSYADTKDRCPDCGVKRGGFHHPGCDQQRCPLCKGQLISCDCGGAKIKRELRVAAIYSIEAAACYLALSNMARIYPDDTLPPTTEGMLTLFDRKRQHAESDEEEEALKIERSSFMKDFRAKKKSKWWRSYLLDRCNIFVTEA